MTFVAPGTVPDLGHTLSRDVAQKLSRNWWVLLLNGATLVVAGVLIFSIDWTVRSLATFIGALFIFEGLSLALTSGIDQRVRQTTLRRLMAAVLLTRAARRRRGRRRR